MLSWFGIGIGIGLVLAAHAFNNYDTGNVRVFFNKNGGKTHNVMQFLNFPKKNVRKHFQEKNFN